MTNPKTLSTEIKNELLSNDQFQFIGFNEFNRPNSFWIELNEIFYQKPKIELYIYSYSDKYNLDFLELLTNVKVLKTFRIHQLEKIEYLKKLEKLQLWDGMKTIDLTFLKPLNLLEDLYIRSKSKSFKF